ncbi:hypothetical protein QYM36_017475 [Artemia franciscana]|uniref:AF-9 ANC1 homology domain-containing protein n=1 Tax=Artemia franciscana TaxID=6661 RepID=A0AA88HBZ7_ARTSF|nr:hypothetical protein QYM36_017475 [Artemia franciscana]
MFKFTYLGASDCAEPKESKSSKEKSKEWSSVKLEGGEDEKDRRKQKKYDKTKHVEPEKEEFRIVTDKVKELIEKDKEKAKELDKNHKSDEKSKEKMEKTEKFSKQKTEEKSHLVEKEKPSREKFTGAKNEQKKDDRNSKSEEKKNSEHKEKRKKDNESKSSEKLINIKHSTDKKEVRDQVTVEQQDIAPKVNTEFRDIIREGVTEILLENKVKVKKDSTTYVSAISLSSTSQVFSGYSSQTLSIEQKKFKAPRGNKEVNNNQEVINGKPCSASKNENDTKVEGRDSPPSAENVMKSKRSIKSNVIEREKKLVKKQAIAAATLKKHSSLSGPSASLEEGETVDNKPTSRISLSAQKVERSVPSEQPVILAHLHELVDLPPLLLSEDSSDEEVKKSPKSVPRARKTSLLGKTSMFFSSDDTFESENDKPTSILVKESLNSQVFSSDSCQTLPTEQIRFKDPISIKEVNNNQKVISCKPYSSKNEKDVKVEGRDSAPAAQNIMKTKRTITTNVIEREKKMEDKKKQAISSSLSGPSNSLEKGEIVDNKQTTMISLFANQNDISKPSGMPPLLAHVPSLLLSEDSSDEEVKKSPKFIPRVQKTSLLCKTRIFSSSTDTSESESDEPPSIVVEESRCQKRPRYASSERCVSRIKRVTSLRIPPETVTTDHRDYTETKPAEVRTDLEKEFADSSSLAKNYSAKKTSSKDVIEKEKKLMDKKRQEKGAAKLKKRLSFLSESSTSSNTSFALVKQSLPQKRPRDASSERCVPLLKRVPSPRLPFEPVIRQEPVTPVHEDYQETKPDRLQCKDYNSEFSNPYRFTKDHLEDLMELQRRVSSVSDPNTAQKIVEIVEETGCFEYTAKTFDFNASKLDVVTVRKLRNLLSF